MSPRLPANRSLVSTNTEDTPEDSGDESVNILDPPPRRAPYVFGENPKVVLGGGNGLLHTDRAL